MNLILKIKAAIQTGKEEYPPIPKTMDGLLDAKIIIDSIIERKIFMKEYKIVKIFFFIRGDEDIFLK